jgi:hypothetical protein
VAFERRQQSRRNSKAAYLVIDQKHECKRTLRPVRSNNRIGPGFGSASFFEVSRMPDCNGGIGKRWKDLYLRADFLIVGSVGCGSDNRSWRVAGSALVQSGTRTGQRLAAAAPPEPAGLGKKSRSAVKWFNDRPGALIL